VIASGARAWTQGRVHPILVFLSSLLEPPQGANELSGSRFRRPSGAQGINKEWHSLSLVPSRRGRREARNPKLAPRSLAEGGPECRINDEQGYLPDAAYHKTQGVRIRVWVPRLARPAVSLAKRKSTACKQAVAPQTTTHRGWWRQVNSPVSSGLPRPATTGVQNFQHAVTIYIATCCGRKCPVPLSGALENPTSTPIPDRLKTFNREFFPP